MKKKNYIILIVTIGLLVFSGVTSLAYVTYQGTTKAQVTTGTLHVTLSQNTMSLDKLKEPVMPLDTIQKELYINTSGSYNQYLRIQCYRYWTNQTEDFEVAPDSDGSLIELALTNPTDWIMIQNNDNKGLVTLYYKYPVSPNTKLKVMDHIKIGNIPSDLQNVYTQYGLQIDAKADGVQQIGNKKGIDAQAISDVWGVKASIDEKGTIQTIES